MHHPFNDGSGVEQVGPQRPGEQSAGRSRSDQHSIDLGDEIGDRGLGDLTSLVPQQHVCGSGKPTQSLVIPLPSRGLVCEELVPAVHRPVVERNRERGRIGRLELGVLEFRGPIAGNQKSKSPG